MSNTLGVLIAFELDKFNDIDDINKKNNVKKKKTFIKIFGKKIQAEEIKINKEQEIIDYTERNRFIVNGLLEDFGLQWALMGEKELDSNITKPLCVTPDKQCSFSCQYYKNGKCNFSF